MKLELKHLAPYLPYGLNTKFQLSGVIGLITEQRDESRDKKLTADSCDFVLKFCKPILRPLSDLTKEIEVDGENFVPLNELGFIENHCLAMALFFDEGDLKEIPYRIIKKLLEWHFDIYGLIEKDLAIDINTLKK